MIALADILFIDLFRVMEGCPSHDDTTQFIRFQVGYRGEGAGPSNLDIDPDNGSGFLGNFDTDISTPEGTVTIAHGAAVVATGGEQTKPTEYLYGEHDRVLTTLEMDAALAEEADMIKTAKAAVFIQCVGSREPERPYCSKICCSHSVESALKVKELNPECESYRAFDIFL